VVVLATAATLSTAVLVNGIPITRFAVIRELEQQGGKQVLDGLISNELVFQEAGREGVKVSDADINAQIKTIEDSLKSQGQTLDEALVAQGMTRVDLFDQLKVQKIAEAILGPKITISNKEISDYFAANKSTYAGKKISEVTDDVKSQIYQEKLNSQYTQWIADLKAKAKIFFLVNYQ